MKTYTHGPLTTSGPSPGGTPLDDGGDYSVLDADGKIIGEAIHRVGDTEYRPARANARLWANAYLLVETLEEIRDLARTFLKPDALNLTEEGWAKHRLVSIAVKASISLATIEESDSI